MPSMWYPVHYKINPKTGEPGQPGGVEYYDNALPWQGWVIDFFDAVQKLSNMPAMSFVHRSKGSAKKSDSPWTQAVTDVEAGLVDAAFSTFWVTAERYGDGFSGKVPTLLAPLLLVGSDIY